MFDSSVKDVAYERGHIMYEMVRLTKINPYLMEAQPEIFKRQSMENIQYRVVSNKPHNPENRADMWESKALHEFESSPTPLFEYGEGLYRFIGPLYMQPLCLTCHGEGDAKEGDVRGGISVEVATKPIIESQYQSRQVMLYMHLAGFLLITSISIFFMHHLRTHWKLLNRTQNQLEDQKQFLSNVTNSMTEGFVVLDTEGRVSFTNPECEQLLGWQDSELKGRDFVELVYSKRNKEGFVLSECAINQTQKDGQVRKELEDLFFDKQGRAVDVSLSVSPLIGKEQSNGVVVMFNDIAERKQAQEERARLERELNQTHKMEAVGHLAGGIAHEINTPIQYVGDNLRFFKEAYEDLSLLLAAYQELLTQVDGDERFKSQVEQVLKAIEEADLDYLNEEMPNAIEQSIGGVEQVARIVLAMKEFAHPGPAKRVKADINRIITNTVAVCRNEWKYVADSELQLEEDLPLVNCVGGEISQVLLNLIVNAAHAIKAAEREHKGKITIATHLHEDQLEIRVADTGTGIPEDVQEYVFNPFFTTNDVGSGTGQGLAIVQDIINTKHHGTIFFETKEGVGTTFIIHLPLSDESETPNAML
jgi:two-component system, NtrC family, sensor kinase